MLREAEESNAIKGLRVTRYGPGVSQLFFTDDSLLFFGAKDSEARVVHDILR